MDYASIKQRKTSSPGKDQRFDSSDEEAAYENSHKQENGAFGIEGLDSTLFTKQITAPTTFIIILLISVLFLLAYEFGNLQH